MPRSKTTTPSPRSDLTPVGQTHLAALQRVWRTHQMLLPMADLAPELGLAGRSGVYRVLHDLQRRGYLRQAEGRRFLPTDKFFELPLVSSVRAGLPQALSQESQPEMLGIDALLVQDREHTVFCRVRGDSMKDAGLLDGDLVVTVTNAQAKEGDIVVALVDGEATVKVLRRDDLGAYLEPANEAYPVIRPAGRLEILGVVTGSFRCYEVRRVPPQRTTPRARVQS